MPRLRVFAVFFIYLQISHSAVISTNDLITPSTDATLHLDTSKSITDSTYVDYNKYVTEPTDLENHKSVTYTKDETDQTRHTEELINELLADDKVMEKIKPIVDNLIQKMVPIMKSVQNGKKIEDNEVSLDHNKDDVSIQEIISIVKKVLQDTPLEEVLKETTVDEENVEDNYPGFVSTQKLDVEKQLNQETSTLRSYLDTSNVDYDMKNRFSDHDDRTSIEEIIPRSRSKINNNRETGSSEAETEETVNEGETNKEKVDDASFTQLELQEEFTTEPAPTVDDEREIGNIIKEIITLTGVFTKFMQNTEDSNVYTLQGNVYQRTPSVKIFSDESTKIETGTEDSNERADNDFEQKINKDSQDENTNSSPKFVQINNIMQTFSGLQNTIEKMIKAEEAEIEKMISQRRFHHHGHSHGYFDHITPIRHHHNHGFHTHQQNQPEHHVVEIYVPMQEFIPGLISPSYHNVPTAKLEIDKMPKYQEGMSLYEHTFNNAQGQQIYQLNDHKDFVPQVDQKPLTLLDILGHNTQDLQNPFQNYYPPAYGSEQQEQQYSEPTFMYPAQEITPQFETNDNQEQYDQNTDNQFDLEEAIKSLEGLLNEGLPLLR